MDTEIVCFIQPEVVMRRRKFSREFKIDAVKLVRERGVSAARAARDLDIHENVLRNWVKEFGSDPVQVFPGHGQMKPEQQEIERLWREVAKLKAERDILKKATAFFEGSDMKFVFIATHWNVWPVAWLCNAMGVSRSGFYAWPIAQRQIPKRRGCRPASEGKLPCQRSILWSAPYLA